MTNQPTVTGTSPASVSVRSASRTTVGCYGTARGVVAPETDYHVRHVWREMNIPWPLGFEQLTPVTIDRQLNIWFYVDVKDEDGKTTTWGFSAAPPGSFTIPTRQRPAGTATRSTQPSAR